MKKKSADSRGKEAAGRAIREVASEDEDEASQAAAAKEIPVCGTDVSSNTIAAQDDASAVSPAKEGGFTTPSAVSPAEEGSGTTPSSSAKDAGVVVDGNSFPFPRHVDFVCLPDDEPVASQQLSSSEIRKRLALRRERRGSHRGSGSVSGEVGSGSMAG